MKSTLIALGLVTLAACGFQTPTTTAVTEQPLSSATGRWIVVYKNEAVPNNAADKISRAGGKHALSVPGIGVATAVGDGAFAAKLAKDPAVLAVGPEILRLAPKAVHAEAVTEEDTYADPAATDSGYVWFQWYYRRIGASAAWSRVSLELQSAVKVAVLDTGVMDDHPDLAGQVVSTIATGYCPEPVGPKSPSYPVYTQLIDFDAYPTWTPGVSPCTTAPEMYNSHGTHVAGTIAAKLGGGVGTGTLGRLVGVAPGAKIAAYKVFDRFRYTDSSGVQDDVGGFDGPIFLAIWHAAVSGIPVINMSLGGTIAHFDKESNASWHAWDRVAKFANRMGTTIVASAGNATQDSNGPLAHVPSDLSSVISVSAAGSSNVVCFDGNPASNCLGGHYEAVGGDVLAWYSNYGASTDVSAPGGCDDVACLRKNMILSTIIGGDLPGTVPGLAYNAFFAGTSMASPHVAAVAALVKAQHPDWNPGQVRSHLKATAEAIGSRQLFGHGLVSADAATR
jgi:subtilisin family serine protease